jgi:hypothetical protein
VGAGSAGGGGGVGRPTPKPVWTPPSAEPKGVSTPTLVPSDAEAEAVGGAGSGGGGGSGGPLTSNPKSPPPEASAPIVSASALPAPASENASARARDLQGRTYSRFRQQMSPLSVVGFGATPRETVTRSVGRRSPRCPGSHQGTAGPDAGGVKPRSKGPTEPVDDKPRNRPAPHPGPERWHEPDDVFGVGGYLVIANTERWQRLPRFVACAHFFPTRVVKYSLLRPFGW